MKVYLASYATSEFRSAQKLLKATALEHGVDRVYSFVRKDLIKSEYYQKNKHILDQKRGAGYWIWKPFFILNILEKLKEEDILIYSDAGIAIDKDLHPLFDLCKQQNGILIFDNKPHICKRWTKRDCFILMDCDTERYYNAEQCMGGFMLLQNKQHVIELIREWQDYMENPCIVTDIPNQSGENLASFIDHRHDQSVLSLLVEKRKIELFRDPSQWGNPTKMEEFREANEILHRPYEKEVMINSPYATLIFIHRIRKRKSILYIKRLRRKIGSLNTEGD